jgi:hypothetical protein
MIRTIPEVREWTTLVLASSIYYSTCVFLSRDSAHFESMTPAARYPFIVQAQTLLAAQS